MADQKQLAPFSTSFSPNVPELLSKLNISLLVSTYQAGKVCLLSPRDEEGMVILPRNFPHATALEYHKGKLAIASQGSVLVLKNEPRLASSYPSQPDTHDSIFLPMTQHFTGPIAVHGLAFSPEGLLGVNTMFSCLVRFGGGQSFSPVWKPWFIDELVPEDRCHLNGLAAENGRPRFVTAFNRGGREGESWRSGNYMDGLVIDVDGNRPLATGLAMPHSPLLYQGKLLVLESAKGTLKEINTADGEVRELRRIGGFLRGMDSYGDFLFIGESKIRKNSSTFRGMEIADEAKQAGVYIFHYPSGSIVGRIQFNASVDEIYEVRVLPGMKRPNIINTEKGLETRFISVPSHASWAAPGK